MPKQAKLTLQEELVQLCAAQSFRTTWSFLNLCGAGSCDGDGDVLMPAASTRKVAILLAALAEVRHGALDLEQKIVIDRALQDNDSGCLRYFRPGLVITLYDALLMMIIVSDNCATAAIVALVGLDAINRHTQALGMTRTTHRAAAPALSHLDDPTPSDLSRSNATTANDMRHALAALVSGADDERAAAAIELTGDLCGLALHILRAQQFRTMLPALLPTETQVAHKTGSGPSTASDVGIIYRDGAPRFILAAYTADIPVTLADGMPGRPAAHRHVARLARLCWDRLGAGEPAMPRP